MRRWIGPLIIALIMAALGYHVALVQTPRVLMHMAVSRVSKGAGFNALYAAPLATAEARAIVRPSPDLAYSSCPYDVSKGPVLVEVPPMPAPYWSLSVFDSRTDTAFVRNNLQANGQAIRIAIIASGTQGPAGYEPVPVEGTTGVALVRILVPDRVNFAAIDQARKTASCRAM